MSVVDAAWGIHEIVNENMATAARLHVLQRGEDPRNFALVAFGGAGPVHAHRVARKLGIGRIVYPLGAGVASAFGLTAAPMSTDLVRSYVTRLGEARWETINALFAEMEAEALHKVGQDAGAPSKLTRLADMRYIQQGYEIQVVLPDGAYSSDSHAAFEQAFFATYERIFGRRVTNVPVQLVNLRLYARGAQPEPPAGAASGRGDADALSPGERPVYFGPAHGFIQCPVYRRKSLARGTRLKGPAILEEDETTVIMEPDAEGVIDDSLNLVVTIPTSEFRKTGLAHDLQFGPVELEIAWGRLISIQDESALALVRTSFSTIVREAQDYTVILLDRNGRSVAQPTATAPAFTGTMPRTMQHFLERYPLETWQPGDVAITNDPWMGTGHVNDVNIARPIFHRGRLVAFVGLVAHTADIGGILWSAAAQEVYEEGLQIPISKLFSRGEPNEDVFNFIRTNVRLPDIVVGDLYAMNAAGEVVDRRLNEFLDELGGERWEALVDEIIGRTENAFREKLRKLPEGVYRHAIQLDGYGEPLTVAGAVTVRDGGLHVDYSGTSTQVAFAMNSPYTYTYAYTCHPLKCVIDPLIPNNEGTFRAISVTAPQGTIVNPRYPAAVGARNLTGQTLYAVLLGALAPAIPDRVIAEGSSPRPAIVVSGFRADGQRFQNMFFIIGGLGARKGADGMACLPFPTNTKATPVEIMETTTPILVERKCIVADTGGAGAWRGGLAQEIIVRNLSPNPMRLSLLSERTQEPPQGVFGGKPGGLPAFYVEDGTAINPKGITVIKASQSFVIRTHGGAGYGAVADRDPQRIRRDLEQGYITPAAARRDYGFFVE
jgi:N-methylhydantoinase B/oxoprolinase/acetone carboxylase alpha subunit